MTIVMTNINQIEQDSLNFLTNSENFSIIISKLKALNIYLNDYPESKCKNDYLSTMAHLLEHYLNSQQQFFLRHYLGKIIVENIKDHGAAKYFKKRLPNTNILNLLQYHHDLTGKRVFLTNIDYNNEKFKVRIF